MSSSTLKTHLLHDIAEAAEFLKRGKLVAFPTETVFGLGADARNARAIERLFLAKGRPADNPLIVHLADLANWPLAAAELPELARCILERYCPGPVTVVVPKATNICSRVTAGLDTVGLRIPAASEARALLSAAGIPIAAPSANLSGRPSGTSWQSVLEDLDGRIDAILCISVEHVGLESTVIDCTGEAPILLRPGSLGLAELQSLYPNARSLDRELNREPYRESNREPRRQGESNSASLDRSVNSPGLRHPHYQPLAQVQLLESAKCWSSETATARSCAYAGLDQSPPEMQLSRQFNDIAEYAQGFYEFLRSADRAGCELIVLQAIAIEAAGQSGIAAALRDRQRRAAGLDNPNCNG
ncbi:MAG: threonylcarbamoyl-AMP synthase [Pirellulaceae bacterium]|jgi:L-threonylcarbamoyladenylate synthase|nr:threonylcarbamoyl-AMP synthase [Pirellulaceae bacterium]